eukprot:TRINITY_DN11659_c0_g1_i1.p1 TRINITY_DN11659_c0_g1~~TRINITY_DN11659_c0_g1_i1.p1  ORF type:complete len:775 (+),score=76.26 TRINITY_DN11659_c0_g1_i1:132-2456(+)
MSSNISVSPLRVVGFACTLAAIAALFLATSAPKRYVTNVEVYAQGKPVIPDLSSLTPSTQNTNNIPLINVPIPTVSHPVYSVPDFGVADQLRSPPPTIPQSQHGGLTPTLSHSPSPRPIQRSVTPTSPYSSVLVTPTATSDSASTPPVNDSTSTVGGTGLSVFSSAPGFVFGIPPQMVGPQVFVTRPPISRIMDRVSVVPSKHAGESTQGPFAPVVLHFVHALPPLDPSLVPAPNAFVPHILFQQLRPPSTGAHIPVPAGVWTRHGFVVPVPQVPGGIFLDHVVAVEHTFWPYFEAKGSRPPNRFPNFIPFVYDVTDGSDSPAAATYEVSTATIHAVAASEGNFVAAREAAPARDRVRLGNPLPPTDIMLFSADKEAGGVGYGRGSPLTPPVVGPQVFWPPAEDGSLGGAHVIRVAIIAAGKNDGCEATVMAATAHYLYPHGGTTPRWYPGANNATPGRAGGHYEDFKFFFVGPKSSAQASASVWAQVAKAVQQEPRMRRMMAAVEHVGNEQAYWRAMTLRRDVLFALMRSYGIPYAGVWWPRGSPLERAQWTASEGANFNAGSFVRAWHIFSLFYNMHRGAQLKREWSARFGRSFDVVFRVRPEVTVTIRRGMPPFLLPTSAGGTIPDAEYRVRDETGRTPADRVVATDIGGPQFSGDAPPALRGFFRTRADNAIIGGDTIMDTLMDSWHEDLPRLAQFDEQPGACPGNRHCVFAESIVMRGLQLTGTRGDYLSSGIATFGASRGPPKNDSGDAIIFDEDVKCTRWTRMWGPP